MSKNYTPIPLLYGLVKTPHGRLIPDNKVVDAQNVIFKDGKVERRKGYTELGDNLPLNGAVTAFTWYEQLGTANSYALCFTTRDSYKYNSSTGNWDFITKKYIAGTATCAGSTDAVTGTDTTWSTDWPASTYQIKFCTQDVNTSTVAVTGDLTSGSAVVTDTNTSSLYAGLSVTGTGIPAGTTIDSIDSGTQFTMDANATATSGDEDITATLDDWYTVTSFDSTTGLTLSENGPDTNGAKNYVIRMCWSGDIDDRHSIAMPIESGGDRVVVIANGVDDIQKWDGADECEDLGGSPNNCKYLAFFGSTSGEQLYLGWTIDSGTNQPQTIELSAAGDPEDYTDGLYYDLLDNNYEIVGFSNLHSRLFIWKESSISEGRPSGSATDPLDVYQNKVSDMGTPAISTVDSHSKYCLFLGKDKQVYFYDGINIQKASGEIEYELASNISTTNMSRSFVLSLLEDGLYVLFTPTVEDYPDTAYVYNYNENTWTIWKLANQMTAGSYMYKSTSTTWADLVSAGTTWADLISSGTTWNDLYGSTGNKVYVLGDKDGYVYEWGGTATTDNGTNISAYIKTKDYPLNDTKHAFQLLDVVMGMEQGTGDVQISASVNFGGEWSSWVDLSLVGSTTYKEEVANFIMRGKQVRFWIRNSSGSYFKIESIVAGWRDGGLTLGR